MRIYTKSGDLAFRTFNFPDQQPHFILETYELEFRSVTVELAIKCPRDLFMLLLVVNVLRQHGYSEVNLDIRYLMAARMDRAISSMEPFSLAVVAQLINSCGFTKVRILDVHSEVATRLIRNSVNVLPQSVVSQVMFTLGYPIPVIPDKGAVSRVNAFLPTNAERIYCLKVREISTGDLTGFKVGSFPTCRGGEPVLIIDDICDGGNTFIGLAKELRAAGAKKVYLYVTHGIFSKGMSALKGIDRVYTTDSYWDGFAQNESDSNTSYWPVVIPINMEKL